jgi:hypothetical protein
MGTICSHETSVLNQLTPHNSLEDGRIHFNRDGRLISRIETILPSTENLKPFAECFSEAKRPRREAVYPFSCSIRVKNDWSYIPTPHTPSISANEGTLLLLHGELNVDRKIDGMISRREDRSSLRGTCPSFTLSTTNPTWNYQILDLVQCDPVSVYYSQNHNKTMYHKVLLRSVRVTIIAVEKQ